jgi:hypothetical protein
MSDLPGGRCWGFYFDLLWPPNRASKEGAWRTFLQFGLGNVYLLLKNEKIISGNIISSTKRAKHCEELKMSLQNFC